MLVIRAEAPADLPAIFRVHATAFPTSAEARLVDRLRAAGKAVVALVAELDGQIIGHLLFSPVTVDTAQGTWTGLGLAPVAVLPDRQRQGIGSQLIRAGLDACAKAGTLFVVVLGHPDYYPRFGFRPAAGRGLGNEYGADEAFQVLELKPCSLPPQGSLVKYAPEFADLASS